MRRLVTFACAGGAVLLAACGSDSSSPGGTSSGTVQGQSLVVRDATFADDMGSSGGTTPFDRLTIYLTDGPRACTPTASSTQLVLYVQTTFRVEPGTYSLAPPDPDAGFVATDTISRAVVQSFDAQCMSRITTDSELATGGSFTIESIDAETVQGTFDAVFAAGELQGSFKARGYVCGASADTPPNACL